MLNSSFSLTGKLVVTLTDENGVVKDVRNINNLVVTVGKQFIASLLSSTPQTQMNHMAVGTGTTTPTLADTLLQTEIGTRVTITNAWVSGTQMVSYGATFGPGNGTGALTEAGIFNSGTANAGVMLAHTAFSAVNKGAGDTISVAWTVTVS